MDISNRYSIELNKIGNHLADLEKGHIYELTKTPGTPSCATLAKHLKEDITTLLNLIENDKSSTSEEAADPGATQQTPESQSPKLPAKKSGKHCKPFTEADAQRLDLPELLLNTRYQLDIALTFGEDVLSVLLETARQEEARQATSEDVLAIIMKKAQQHLAMPKE